MSEHSKGILAVIIAHNELELVKLNIQILLGELKDADSEIVVVDNFSKDGLKEWLLAQKNISYLIYKEKMEGYGQILDRVREQFGTQKDLLLLRANYFFTPGSIACMKEALYSSTEIAAVGPVCNGFAGEQRCAAANTYREAIEVRNRLENKMVKTAYLEGDVVLQKGSAVAALDKTIPIPQAVMGKYRERVLKSGACFAVAKQAVCYAAVKSKDEPYQAFSPQIYQQEQLKQLLYSFGDIAYRGVHLYKYLKSDFLVGINQQNKLQNTKRNTDILIWDSDEIELSTEEEAARTRQTLESLPKKDVLFVTLPIRRMHDGACIHTCMESFIASLGEEQYLDLEFRIRLEEDAQYIPTKNWYPVLKSTVARLYGTKQVDKEELSAFLQEKFINPLEEVLNMKFEDGILHHCLLKAAYMLKQRDGYMEFYKEVVSKVQPKVIIYSHGQDMSLTYLRDTALGLGVPTLEIDHGVRTVDPYHKHLVYADHLVVYSSVIADKCRELGNDRVFGIGKPGVYEQVSKPEYKYPTIVISFISSLENEIFEYAKNLALRLDKQKYLVVYKAHNSERWQDEEMERWEKEIGNLQFMSGALDIRDMVGMSDIVVGIRSSGIFDALPFAMVKVIAIKDRAKNFSQAKPNEILREVAGMGEIVMAEDEGQLYQEVMDYKRNVMYRNERNRFYPEDARERFRELVSRYLIT